MTAHPAHDHNQSLQQWRKDELPEGATLVPGVVGHCSDFIEHPDLVAERLIRYANLVGFKGDAALKTVNSLRQS